MPEPSKEVGCVGVTDFQEKGKVQTKRCVKTSGSQGPRSTEDEIAQTDLGGCTGTQKLRSYKLLWGLAKGSGVRPHWSINRWPSHLVPGSVSSGCEKYLESPHTSNTELSPCADGQDWEGPYRVVLACLLLGALMPSRKNTSYWSLSLGFSYTQKGSVGARNEWIIPGNTWSFIYIYPMKDRRAWVVTYNDQIGQISVEL